MRRVLTLAIIFFVSAMTSIIGQIQEHPTILYIGMALGGFVALALMIGLTKIICRFIGNSLTSMLFILTALVAVGFLSHYNIINPIIGFSAGLCLGMMLLLLLMRKLAKKAHTSLILGEIFTFLSSYEIRNYISKDRIIERETHVTNNSDYKNIILILTQQLGYTKTESKTAADFAIKETSETSPIEDKIEKALQYFADHHSVLVDKSRNN